ncbi:hypothetical protein [Martelella sp. AD-3]|uniref:hypothetical protein n=1 Tax=Martelella sp. AD-3 TaxID=686597 RepID=UPI000A494317|nr:hypothetical protein [Martelella sp. AD-3]
MAEVPYSIEAHWYSDLLSFFSDTSNLAAWGAITGTIGVLAGLINLVLRVREHIRDQSKIAAEPVFDFTINPEEANPKFSIVVRAIGRRTVTLDKVEYYYQPSEERFSFLRKHYMWKRRKWVSHDEIQPNNQPVQLSEGTSRTVPISPSRVKNIRHIRRVRIVDQAGRGWRVKWPGRKEITFLTSQDKIKHCEKTTDDKFCKLVGYRAGDKWYVTVQWSSGDLFRSIASRYFSYRDRASFERKFGDLQENQIDRFLSGEITKFE